MNQSPELTSDAPSATGAEGPSHIHVLHWFGALIAVIGEASLLTRLTGRKGSNAAAEDSAAD
ncbi:MAG: hypothetical protein VB860_05340 [Dehalococcoidia bacterium]